METLHLKSEVWTNYDLDRSPKYSPISELRKFLVCFTLVAATLEMVHKADRWRAMKKVR